MKKIKSELFNLPYKLKGYSQIEIASIYSKVQGYTNKPRLVFR